MSIHHDLPDATDGEVPCCMGHAVYGPSGCTCWRPEYDVEQQPIVEGPMHTREKMCADCAYRPDSPERNGVEGYAHNTPDDIEELTCGRNKFVCHQGMRRQLAMVHENGTRVPSCAGAYAPPQHGGAWKADGTPAEFCAGWAAAKRAQEREREAARAEAERAA